MAFEFLRFRRFSIQLLLVLAGLIAVVQVLVFLLISHFNEQSAIDHIESDLQKGALLFRENLNSRIEQLADKGKVISNDDLIRPQLRKEPIDSATLSSILVSYAHRVNTPVITLFSPSGEMLANSDERLGTENMGPFQFLIQKATQEDLEQASGFSYLAGKLYVLVIVPHYAPYPEVHAWFGLAYPVDAAFAQAIKRTRQLDVTFSSNPDEPNVRVLSTTLEPAMAGAVARYATAGHDTSAHSEKVTFNGESYVTFFEPLELLGEASARISLQRSLAVELEPSHDLMLKVFLISLGALAAATVASLLIARNVSEPVQKLAEHTRYVRSGDYARRIELSRRDELGQLATAFNEMTAGLAERDQVRDLLGKVVSPEIAAQLLKSGVELGGEEREVTVLFSDLRSFTSWSEKLAPTEVLVLLNRYLDRMSSIVEKHGGVVDKYIGDAIMALFGAPLAAADDADRAIAAAREMESALADLNRELVAEGKPPLVFGVGINTARVVAGNMGSKTRLNYTVIGDGVNLASRLEGETKNPDYDTRIIVSEATLRAAKNPPAARALGEVKVKGKAEAVKIFALNAKGESQPPYQA